ncbi:MAG: DUF929 family protein [Candidatus Parvarchaeota archaeon]|nr:DUF929 family protein [Candidatus Parvarchaeota archaeon]
MPDEDKEHDNDTNGNDNTNKDLQPEKAVSADKSSEVSSNGQQNKTEEKKVEVAANSNEDELERLRKENERLKEIQRLKEENEKLSVGQAVDSKKQTGKNNLVIPLIIGVVVVAVVVIALILFVIHTPSKATISVLGGKVVFTSANLSGVSNSNFGNSPIPNSLISPNFSAINNSATSLQFFKGPIGQSEPNYVTALSNLSTQLEEVGQSQLNGNIECVPAANTSRGPNPSYCVLLIGSSNYDIVPIKVGGNSTVKVNGSSELKLPLLTYGGKPTFVYIGAQGCPFCAGMRWSIIIALSRFGNFSNLFYDRSATNDANVPTFTFDYNANLFYDAVSKPAIDSGAAPYGDNNPTPFFVGAYYNSSYINFIPLDETGSSFLVNITGIATVSPFVFNNVVLASQAFTSYHGFGIYNFLAGGVPFFDINNQYVFDGASINAGTYLTSSGLNPAYSTHQDMLNSIENPTSGSFGQTVLGAANILTAQICETLNNTAPVCSLSYISGLESKLNTIKV